jgi:hypothetical protein
MKLHTNGNGFITTGAFEKDWYKDRLLGKTNADFYTVFFNWNGDSVWTTKHNSDTNVYEVNFNIHNTKNHIYTAGIRYRFYPTVYEERIQLVKSDTNGVPLWIKYYGDSLAHNEEPYFVISTRDNHLVIAGVQKVPPGYWKQVIIYKLDTAGNVIWRRVMPHSGLDDTYHYCLELPDSNLAFLGYYQNNGFRDGKARLSILDPSGNIISDYTFNAPPFLGATGTLAMLGNGIIDSRKRLVCVGSAGGYPGFPYLCFLNPPYNNVKLEDHHIYLPKELNGIKDAFEGDFTEGQLGIVHENPDSTYTIAGILWAGQAPIGFTKWYGVLFKADSTGNILWYRTFTEKPNYDHYFYSMEPTPDGGYLCTGRAEDYGVWVGSTRYMDASIYMVKTNCAGFVDKPKVAKVQHSGNSGLSLLLRVENTDSMMVYWGDNTRTKYNMVQFVEKDTLLFHDYGKSGTYNVKVKVYACGEVDSLLLPGMSVIYIGGGMGDIEPVKGKDNVIWSDIQEQYSTNAKVMQLFPNPAESYVYIQCQNNRKAIQGRVVNMQGQVVKTFVIEQETLRLDVQELPQGVYFVQVEGYNVQKLVRQ